MKKVALALIFIFLVSAPGVLAHEKIFYKEKTDEGMVMFKYFLNDHEDHKGDNGDGDETPSPTSSPDPSESPAPSPSGSPSPSPTATPDPSESPSPTGEPTASPTASPTPNVLGEEVENTMGGIRALIDQLIAFIRNLLSPTE